jgi:type I restriction enzyme S subunit
VISSALKELIVIKKGKKEKLDNESGENVVRFIQIEDLRNNNNLKYCQQDSSSTKVKESDIIIAWDGANAGIIGTNLQGVIGSTLAKLEPRNSLFNSRYIAKYLSSKNKLLRGACTGATIPHINRKTLENLQIPLPPLPVQETIVQVLDKAQELIDLREKQIKMLDELVQSVFYDMFGDPETNPKGWEDSKIKSLCLILTDGTHFPPKFSDEGIPFLFVSNIKNGKIDYNTKKFISTEDYRKLIKRTPVEIGDILFTIVGSYGNGAIVESEKEFCFQRHIAYLKPNHEKINSIYLVNAMKSNNFKHQMEKRVRGVAQKTLNLSELNKIMIPLPPISLQNEFASKVQAIEAQKELMQASLDEMKNNYNSLIQRAFRGDLF